MDLKKPDVSLSGGVYFKLNVDDANRHATRLVIRKDVILSMVDDEKYLTIEFDQSITNGNR